MSTKRETYRQALRPLLLAALNSPGLLSPSEFKMARFSLDPARRAHLIDPDISALEDYLIDNSNLPGPRGNLELIAAFADEVGALCRASDLSLNRSYVALEWLLRDLMNRYPPVVFGGDPGSPLQMPQLCSAVAFGEWAAAFSHIEAGVWELLTLAESSLWRVREGAAMGLQRMLGTTWSPTIRRLRRQSIDARAYQWRGIVAGVAEPSLLTDSARALDALDLHYGALSYLRRLPPAVRRSDPVLTLRQALGYSVSVVVVAVPEAGFSQMQTWTRWDDPDINWVIRENLKKKRLDRWPEQVESLRAQVRQAG